MHSRKMTEFNRFFLSKGMMVSNPLTNKLKEPDLTKTQNFNTRTRKIENLVNELKNNSQTNK